MTTSKSDLLHGTLEMLVLQLVEQEAMNGYAIGRRLESLTDDALSVDEGSLYPALYRMEKRGWLRSSWGTTENKRRAKFYRITKSGSKRLDSARANWTDFARAVGRVLESD